jgi:23S rRNA (uracil1939-C5)-methyltransferase
MHLDERTQEDAREEIVRQALGRVGGVANPPPMQRLCSPVSLGYRARARVAVVDGRVGFRELASHRVVDVSRCLVLDPDTQGELERLREHPPRRRMDVEIRGFGSHVEVGGATLRVRRGSFFQANRYLWHSWQSAVAEACGRGDCLVELYAGTGLYTVALTDRFEKVVAVERGSSAEDARHNTTATIVNHEAELWAPDHLPDLKPDVVLVNPPRIGCDPRVVEAIRTAAPSRVVYVSCDPSTLARDVNRLSNEYCVKHLLLIDALPQTHHAEVLCTLELKKTVSVDGEVLTARRDPS